MRKEICIKNQVSELEKVAQFIEEISCLFRRYSKICSYAIKQHFLQVFHYG